MNPITQLKNPDGALAKAWTCGCCGDVHTYESSAVGCCECWICKRPKSEEGHSVLACQKKRTLNIIAKAFHAIKNLSPEDFDKVRSASSGAGFLQNIPYEVEALKK